MGPVAGGILDSCLLCDVLRSSPDVPFRRLFSVEDAATEILLQTDNFAVVADSAPQVEGHCLAVSKTHVKSTAGVGPAALSELAQLVERAERVLSPHFGPCCLFEHGSGNEAVGTTCIEHAHVHIVPYVGDLRAQSRYRESFVSIDGWSRLDAVPQSLSYLFTRSSSGFFWLSLRQEVERQHWRRVIANAADVDFYDWRLMYESTRGRSLARERVARIREKFEGGA